jgi:uncharacterized membrane-anchored protein
VIGEGWLHFYEQRDRLLAEAHARPSSPIAVPAVVTRIAAMSGQDGVEADRRHMADLCARLGQDGPTGGMRWWSVDHEGWQLRWERHSEFSSWTVAREPVGGGDDNALDALPAEWVRAIPGPVLVLTTLRLRRGHHAHPVPADRHDAIGSRLLDGAATLLTDLRPDATGMTRFEVVMHDDDPVLAGRLALMLLEIETYRLMALLAFPVAGEAAAQVKMLETEVGELANRIADNLGVEDDRALLTRLVALSGRMEALSASTNFRFGAGNAYYEIVLGRIASLRETPIPGMQTVGQFMDRRLGPAMRTCASVAERERALIARIARAGQMINTRIELVTQAINADLLTSMNRRTLAQLRLQQTVEGLSVVAISYYAFSLLLYPLKAVEHVWPRFDPVIASGFIAPAVVVAVWFALSRIRRRIGSEH